MRYVAAYLLASLGGKDSPTAEDIERILSSVGIEAEPAKLSKVIAELKGKDLATLIAEGHKKLASMPTSGAASPATAATAAAPAATQEAVSKAEEKKEEKKPETDSEDEDMGFGLFD